MNFIERIFAVIAIVTIVCFIAGLAHAEENSIVAEPLIATGNDHEPTKRPDPNDAQQVIIIEQPEPPRK